MTCDAVRALVSRCRYLWIAHCHGRGGRVRVSSSPPSFHLQQHPKKKPGSVWVQSVKFSAPCSSSQCTAN